MPPEIWKIWYQKINHMHYLRTLALFFLILPSLATAETSPPNLFVVSNVAPNVDVVFGGGGNVTVDHGGSQIFMVDDKIPGVSAKLLSTITAISAKSIGTVINTHWHFDHVGGNEALIKAGATVIAQGNVRRRMAAGGTIPFLKMPFTPAPKAQLPNRTYDKELSFHIGDDVIQVVHLPSAHTDGDTVVKWARANVLATGDVYIRYGLPFVDLSSGGTLRGFIAAVERCIAMSDRNTKIVPGHGEVSTRVDLVIFLNRLISITDAIDKEVRAGKSLSEVQALRLADSWPEDARNFVKPEQFVAMAFDSLSSAFAKELVPRHLKRRS